MTPEEIAEQLVTEWQQQDRMPPMAWDFRGFAAAAAKMAAQSEREACAKVCRRRAKAMQETIRTANPRTNEHIMLRRDARMEEARDCAAEIMERSNASHEGPDGSGGTPL